jgi:glycosyltransferase involved in cell wall biosynthesis
MRILVLTPQQFHIDRGTPIDTDLLLRALSARGEEVDMVCLPGGRERSYDGVTIHRVRGPSFIHDIPPGFSLRKVVADVLVFMEAYRLIRSRSFDIVHAGEESVYMARVFKALFGLPYVYDMDSSLAQQMVEQMPWLRPLAPLFDWMEGKAIKGARAVAPVCNALADLAAPHAQGPVVILHDISQLPDPGRKATGLLQERWGIRRPALLYAGNLAPYQGVDLLLDAFALAVKDGSELDLVVVGGTDAEREAYGRKAEGLDIRSRTHFVGTWPADRIGEILAEARILTAPRIRGLNTPMKVFPYLHSGKPVLVTDLPTHSQILDSTVAMLAPPEPEGFAGAILELERDPDLQRRLGKAGREFVEANHTFQAHQKRVDRLYDGLQRAAEVGPGRPGTASPTAST